MSSKPFVIVIGFAIALAGCGVNAGVGGRGAHVGGWLGQNTIGGQTFAQNTYRTDQQMREASPSGSASSASTAADSAEQSNKPAERKSTNEQAAKQMAKEGK